MAESFSFLVLSTTSVRVTLGSDPTYPWYRVYIRLQEDEDDKTYDDFHTPDEFPLEITGLSPNTDYYINVGGNTTGANKVNWIGTEEFTSTPKYYVILHFDANGGDNPPGDIEVSSSVARQQVMLSPAIPTWSGYTFLGWSTNASATTATYPAGSKPYFTGNVEAEPTTLYAVWSKNATYYVKVIYHANGGSGAPSSRTFSSSTSQVPITISSTEPIRDGYRFVGWDPSSDADEVWYKAGAETELQGSTTTREFDLYAVWRPIYWYVEITYIDAKSGTTQISTYWDTDSEVEVTMPTKDVTGFKLLGWATTENATEPEYETGETYPFTGAQNTATPYTLYAVWAELHKVTIVYDANGGAGAPDSETFDDIDNTITVTISQVIPTRTGFTFLGWSFNRTAATAEYAAGGTYYNWLGSPDGTEVTLYAVWSVLDGFGGVWINNEYYYPWIYHNGWHRAAVHVNHNGWSITKEGT